MFVFDTDQVRDLIQGNFQFRPCLECNGKGEVLVDSHYGLQVQAIPEGRDEIDFYTCTCETCEGIGGKIIF